VINVIFKNPLGKFSSIYLAEIRAIIESSHAIKESNITNDIFFTCSDSQADLEALSSVKIKSALTLKCCELLNNLATYNRIDLLWIPAPADELDTKGALNKFIGPEPVMGTPYSNIKQKIRKERTKMFITGIIFLAVVKLKIVSELTKNHQNSY